MKINEFFTPTKWKTIWSENLNLYHRSLFTTNTLKGTIILQIAKNKNNKFRCYVTNGDIRQSIEPLFLFNEYPHVKEILKQNGIKIDEF